MNKAMKMGMMKSKKMWLEKGRQQPAF